ncbi:MAG: hypothetical protein WBP10_18050 [Thermoanaerobaculia bacterium]
MRWRIPIVAALAVFVAASCDQAPTAVEEGTPDSPSYVVLENEWAEYSFSFPHCEEVVDAVQRYKHLETLTETPSGNVIYQDKFNIHGTAVGRDTGYEYVWNDVWTIWQESSGPKRAYNDHYTDNFHIIGKGQAPDFHEKVTWAITYNANGEMAVEVLNVSQTCK